jgi:hypothetical protein
MRAAPYLPLAVEALAAHKPFFTSKVSEMLLNSARRWDRAGRPRWSADGA